VAESLSEAPNLAIIVLDTVRADHLSCYGYGRETSPFIDSLAASGARFPNVSAAANWSLPSHVSLLTGAYPTEHGIWDYPDVVNPRPIQSIAEFLHNAGYDTACFTANPWVRIGGLDRGFGHFVERAALQIGHLNQGTSPVQRLKRRVRAATFATDKGAAQLNRDVESWSADRRKGRPFFVFLNFMEAHHPYAPRRPYHRKYSARPLRTLLRFHKRFNQDRQYLDRSVPLSSVELQSYIDLYDGQIAYVDTQVRRLYETLKIASGGKDLIVAITADHGESFGEHRIDGSPLVLHNFSLYDPLMRVPLVLTGGPFGSGTRVEGARSLIDIAPTFGRLATGKLPLERAQVLDRADPERIVFAEHKTPSTVMDRLRRFSLELGSDRSLHPFVFEAFSARDARFKVSSR
jgi:arylsulfatase A-like enzyme